MPDQVDVAVPVYIADGDAADLLEPYPALRRCAELVMDRPKLRGNFTRLKAWQEGYAQMQAGGEGVE